MSKLTEDIKNICSIHSANPGHLFQMRSVDIARSTTNSLLLWMGGTHSRRSVERIGRKVLC